MEATALATRRAAGLSLRPCQALVSAPLRGSQSLRVQLRPSLKVRAQSKPSPESETPESSNKRDFLKLAMGAAAVGAAALFPKKALAADEPAVASSRMSYSRFLEYLDMDRVKKVGDCLRSPL